MTKAYISRVHFDQHVVEFLNCVACRPRHHSAYVDAVIAQEEGASYQRTREQMDPRDDDMEEAFGDRGYWIVDPS